MTKSTLKKMLLTMTDLWPGRLNGWDAADVLVAWGDLLEPYSDDEVRAGWYVMLHDAGRDQHWPPSAPELLQYVERERAMRLTLQRHREYQERMAEAGAFRNQ